MKTKKYGRCGACGKKLAPDQELEGGWCATCWAGVCAEDNAEGLSAEAAESEGCSPKEYTDCR